MRTSMSSSTSSVRRSRPFSSRDRAVAALIAPVITIGLVLSGGVAYAVESPPPPTPTEEVVSTEDATSGAEQAPAEEVAPDEEAAPTEEESSADEAASGEDAAAEDAASEETVPEEGTGAEETAEQAADDKDAAKEPVASALRAPQADIVALAACETVGGFEIDGNYAAGDCGGLDWASGGYSSSAVVGTYQVVKDNSNPATWQTGGGTPPKVDFIRNYTKADTVDGDYFLWVGWDREQTSGTGGYVIEVTNAGISLGPDGAPRPIRTNGGAVFYITTQGSSPPVLLQACVYASQATYPGTCNDSPSANGFVGAVSDTDLTNPFGQPVEAGGFFEVGMNVTDLTEGIVAPGCPGAGVATAYMRSFTGNNFGPTGNLKGFVGPTLVEPPSTCGSLTIEKKNADGSQSLAGAEFSISPNPTTGAGSTTGTTNASGQIVFSGNVVPGVYTITETAPPPGYLLPAVPSQQVTVGTLESKSVTFNDPLGTLSWNKVDGDGAALGGATFSVTATGGAAAAAPWELDANPITVVDNTGQGGYTGRDTNSAAGAFTVVNLPTGTYSVAETVAPPQYVLDPTPQSATISQATPNPVISTAFVNIPFATVTVKKSWVDAFDGDTATLSVTGGDDAVDTAPGSGAEATVQVAPGTTVTVSEALGGGNQGSYDTTLSCTGAMPSATTGTSAQVTVPDFPASEDGVVCTFTNTAKTTTVTVKKTWVDGVLNDAVDVGVTVLSDDSNPGATFTSMSNGDAGTWADPGSAMATVRVGETFSIGETYPNVPAGTYASSWTCTGLASGPSMTSDTTFPGGLSAPDGDTVCTFTNVNGAFNVVVGKEWINGEAGDAAELSIDGVELTATSFSNGDLGSWIDAANTLTVPVSVGDDVTVREMLSVIAGSADDYTSSISCIDADAFLEGGEPTFEVVADAREITFDMPSIAVVCTVTNEAVAPTLELLKEVDVDGAEVADTNWQLFGELTSGAIVTDPAGGDVAATAVEAGVDIALSEELIGDFAGSDEFAAGEWSCVDADGAVSLDDSSPGAASLPGLGKGAVVVCTIVNEHVDQGYEFEKTAVSSADNGDGEWTVVYDITVTNNSELVEIEYDLTDTLADNDAVTYTAAAWTGPSSGSFALPSTTAQLADGATLAAAGTDVYTVTVDLEVTPTESEVEACEGEESGIGVVNTAEVTVGEESSESEACATVHYDDVQIVKTAGLPDGETSVEPGDTFDYILTVTNNGTQVASDVRVIDDSLFDRLQITDLTVDPDSGWGLEPGYSNDEVDLTIEGIPVGGSVVITVTVLFFSPDPTVVDHDGDPTTDPILPQLVGDEEPPAPPVLVDELVNTACVEMEGDQNPDNDCDTVEVPTRDITALVYTRCINDAPLLGWTVAKSGLLTDEPIDFLWTPNSGDADTDPQQVAITQAGGTTSWTQEIAWPGAAFTPSGISIDYPGWRPLEAADYAPDGGYYLPGTDTVMTAEEQAEYVFNGLILDPSELDYAWRLDTTVVFSVNPELTFTTSYPPATPDCFVARNTEVQIEKTASVERSQPGESFTYDLAVANVSDDAAAEGVVVADAIPADLKVTDVSWPGEGDDEAFPNWESCAVTGQSSSGYGGTLECTLFGPLQPAGAGLGPSDAPTITLAVVVNPSSTASVVTNVAVVDYHTFGDPDDPGRDSDDATVVLSSLPATGSGPILGPLTLALLALLGGVLALMARHRRRTEPIG